MRVSGWFVVAGGVAGVFAGFALGRQVTQNNVTRLQAYVEEEKRKAAEKAAKARSVASEVVP